MGDDFGSEEGVESIEGRIAESGPNPGSLTLTEARLAADAGAAPIAMRTSNTPRIAIRRNSMEVLSEEPLHK